MKREFVRRDSEHGLNAGIGLNQDAPTWVRAAEGPRLTLLVGKDAASAAPGGDQPPERS